MFFDDVLGQEHAQAFLRDALKTSRLPHAMLFVGPDGVGKWLVALCLARRLMCEEATGCARCRGCRRVDSGNHPDLMNVSRDSRRTLITLEQLGEIREFLLFEPLEASSRVAIIRDAHRMRGEAQDSLLKTLEEPPPDSVLILVTHRPELLRPTVRSRCQTVSFSCLSQPDLRRLASRLGLSVPESFPVELAAGRPGVLREMVEEDLLGARRVFLALLRDPVEAPIVHLSVALNEWTREGNALKELAERERRRERLRMALGLFGMVVRDIYALRLVGERASVLNNDCMGELTAAAGPATFEEADAVIEAIAAARRALSVNVSADLVVENLLLEVRDLLGARVAREPARSRHR